MRNVRENPYKAVFTPRFRLSDTTLVGFEVRIKQAQRLLSANDAFKLIQSGNGGALLNQIKSQLWQWCEKAEKSLYLSWEVSSRTSSDELKCFLHEWSLVLPPEQLEIVLNADNLETDAVLSKVKQLFSNFPGKGIRRGLLHSRPCDFFDDADELCLCIDSFKIKKGAIMDMKDTASVAYRGYSLIDRFNRENIAIVADDLYCKEDMTSAILMGIQYGQGYFLSRNQAPQIPVKTLKKKSGTDVYERSFDCFENLLWT